MVECRVSTGQGGREKTFRFEMTIRPLSIVLIGELASPLSPGLAAECGVVGREFTSLKPGRERVLMEALTA